MPLLYFASKVRPFLQRTEMDESQLSQHKLDHPFDERSADTLPLG